MRVNQLLLESFQRVHDGVHRLLDGIDEQSLRYRTDSDANTIAWLVWHLTRIQDDHICDLAEVEQAWTAKGWSERFGLPFETSATGYGHSAAEVAAVTAGAESLLGYYDAVHEVTRDFVANLDEEELDRIVDARWDPPVTMLVRLVSVIEDDIQHLGQAAYIRGLAERAS